MPTPHKLRHQLERHGDHEAYERHHARAQQQHLVAVQDAVAAREPNHHGNQHAAGGKAVQQGLRVEHARADMQQLCGAACAKKRVGKGDDQQHGQLPGEHAQRRARAGQRKVVGDCGKQAHPHQRRLAQRHGKNQHRQQVRYRHERMIQPPCAGVFHLTSSPRSSVYAHTMRSPPLSWYLPQLTLGNTPSTLYIQPLPPPHWNSARPLMLRT